MQKHDNSKKTIIVIISSIALLSFIALCTFCGGLIWFVKTSFTRSPTINQIYTELDKEALVVWFDKYYEGVKSGIVDSVSSENLQSSVSYLSQTIGPRVGGSREEKISAVWLKEEFEKLGYEVELQSFVLSNGLISRNVTAFKEDDFVEDKKIIIIGAHYDSVPASPGAMDNASGVSAVLEIATVLAETRIKIRCNLVFILFSAEECSDSACSGSLQGSEYYVLTLKEIEKQSTQGMINLDMIGEDDEVQIRREAGLSDKLANETYEAFVEVGLTTNIVQSRDWSDHESFEAVRIPAVFIFTPNYEFGHTPEDTVDKVNFEKVSKVTKGVVRFLLDSDCETH